MAIHLDGYTSPSSTESPSPPSSPSVFSRITQFASRILFGNPDPLTASPFAKSVELTTPLITPTPVVVIEPTPDPITAADPAPSILTRIGTIAKEVILPTKATIKGAAFAAATMLSGASAASAVVSALFVENPIAKYILLGGCTAASAFFARRSIAYFPNFQEWFLWAFHSISHPAYLLLGTPAWLQTREVYTGLFITCSVLSALIAHDVSSRALDKLLQGQTAADLERAFHLAGKKTQTNIHASPLAKFIHNHWKSIAFTIAMLVPTVAFSVPSVTASVRTGSPFLDNLITVVFGNAVNIAASIPLGYHLTKKVHYAHIFRNIVQTDEKTWKNIALKVGNFILTKGNLLVTVGLGLTVNAGTLLPDNIAGIIVLSTLALFFMAGIGLGGNHAIFETHYLLKNDEQFKDLELGDALANPKIKSESIKNAIEKWDSLFGAAQWLRQNMGTVIGCPAVVLASLSEAFANLPVPALFRLRVGFSAFLAGALIQGYVSNSFTREHSPDNGTFLEKVKAFVEYIIETKQTEFLILFTLLAYSETTYLPDGTKEIITAMVIAANAVLGFINGTGQSFQNRTQRSREDEEGATRSIQSSAAFAGVTVALGFSLASTP